MRHRGREGIPSRGGFRRRGRAVRGAGRRIPRRLGDGTAGALAVQPRRGDRQGPRGAAPDPPRGRVHAPRRPVSPVGRHGRLRGLQQLGLQQNQHRDSLEWMGGGEVHRPEPLSCDEATVRIRAAMPAIRCLSVERGLRTRARCARARRNGRPRRAPSSSYRCRIAARSCASPFSRRWNEISCLSPKPQVRITAHRLR